MELPAENDAKLPGPDGAAPVAEPVLARSLEQCPMAVLLTDQQGRPVYVNEKWSALTGYTRAEAAALPVSPLRAGEMTRDFYDELWRTLAAGREWHGEMLGRRKDGTDFWELASIAPVRDREGTIVNYLKVALDITSRRSQEQDLRRARRALAIQEATMRVSHAQLLSRAQALKRNENKLSQIANVDELTGLLNRRGFEQVMQPLRGRLVDRRGGMGILIVDLDNFKLVNDYHGHSIGDQVLRECADLLRKTVRETDILCRYGGDEIVVALPDTNAQETRATAVRVLEIVRRHRFSEDKGDLRITVSVGAAFGDVTAGEAVGTVLVKADHALHRAKEEGRNRTSFWEGNAAVSPAADPSAERIETSPGFLPRLGRILLVDDEPTILNIFQRVLTKAGYEVVQNVAAAEARASMERERGRFDIALLDLHLPEQNGLELLKELRAMDETLVGILITGRATMDHVVNAMRSGAFDFIIKPIGTAQLLTVLERAIGYRRLLLANRHYQLHLEEMVQEKSSALLQAVNQLRTAKNATLEILCAMLDAREHPAEIHGKRVARMACRLAQAMGLPEDQVAVIRQAAMLHDIGKIAIPDAILLKESALADEEWRIIRNHPQIGFSILAASPDLERTAEIVLAHQERYDGSGYPQGLKGDAICLGARIFAVVDGYDAMRMGRPYASSRSASESLMEIKRCSGTQFDPAVVETFVRCHAEIEAATADCS